jgi:lipoprotein-anchoring transpeptidase ErfK/SrfK
MPSAARSPALLALAAAALAGGVAAAISLAGAPGDASGRPARAARPFVIPLPVSLPEIPRLMRWAPVKRAAIARAAPRSRAQPVATVGRRTPESTANVVLVLGRSRASGDGVWLRARIPGGAVGWLPRRALGGYTLVTTQLVVDRQRLTATLYRGGRPLFSARVAIGRASAPTPAGRFYVRDKLERYHRAMYGPLAFGTSARAPGVTDWPAGGFVGIHGTDRPDLIPGRVSHGCIRMRNADILRLGQLMPVGTAIAVT